METAVPVPVEEFHALLMELGEVKKHMDTVMEMVKQVLSKIERQAKQEAR